MVPELTIRPDHEIWCSDTDGEARSSAVCAVVFFNDQACAVLLRSFFDLASSGFYLCRPAIGTDYRIDQIKPSLEIVELQRHFAQSVFAVVSLNKSIWLDPQHDWTAMEMPGSIGSSIHFETNATASDRVNAMLTGRNATVHLNENHDISDCLILSLSNKFMEECPNQILGKTAFHETTPVGVAFALNRASNCVYLTSFHDKLLELEDLLAANTIDARKMLSPTAHGVMAWNNLVHELESNSSAPKNLDEAVRKLDEYSLKLDLSSNQKAAKINLKDLSVLFDGLSLGLNVLTNEIHELEKGQADCDDIVELNKFILDHLMVEERVT